ncbi:MAG: FGGY family carbohydrate kinase, partial [Kiritimatiellia bacterium]
MSKAKYALGLDFGTNSVRALVVDTADGSEVGTAVHNYASGENGIILDRHDPDLARQHPLDYLRGIDQSVKAALRQARKTQDFKPEAVIGIGVDTTGSTPLPLDRAGQPLAANKR